MDTFETIQSVCSILAILISLGSIIYTYIISGKQTKLKMRENYYQPVFEEMLIKKLPQVFTDFIDIKKRIVYEGASTEFEKTIGEFRKKIKFLQFADIDMYNIIDDLLIKIDDDIVLLCSNRENKEEKISSIHELMKKLYKEINNYYK